MSLALRTFLMCIVMKLSCGAEVIVKGCHSKVDMDGTLMNAYMPEVKWNPRGFLRGGTEW